ncbi:MAG: alpha-amylase family glycosyl hydrolase [Chloroflexota bacterium]
MIDNIFGNLIEPGNRLVNYRENRTGVKHLHRQSPLDPIPGQPILLTLTTGGAHPYSNARCSYTLDGSDPGSPATTVLDMESHSVEWDEIAWGYLKTWTVSLPAQPAQTLIRYQLAARRADSGDWTYADSGTEDSTRAESFSLWVDDDPIPEWARAAIVYQVFPDRFYPGDGRAWNKASSLTDFYGGTLRGIIDKLDTIQSLGFNTIWLNPFFKTSSHHGYNASDYYTVEPRLGTNADLKELIEQAHARGMRMILDFVANHWSKDHFTFQEAQANPDSPYRDWYLWKHWPDDYECYFNVRELPKINLKTSAAREYMLAVARHWLQEGFDGYRLDFAYGPPHDFWVDFRRACRAVKPDCWIFGEIVHAVPTLLSYTGIMDGTLDFHLARALRETFAFGRMDLAEFEAFLGGHEACFPSEHLRPSFLDNHDEARFLHIAGEDKAKLRLAALVMYTLSGPPIVYCGTETGLSQQRPMHQDGRYIFEEARLPLNWETADSSLQGYFRRLGELRRAHPVLWAGNRQLLHLSSEAGTYAYLRAARQERVVVAVNTGSAPKVISIANPGFENASDHLNGNRVEVQEDKLIVHLPPQSGAFVSPGTNDKTDKGIAHVHHNTRMG